MDNQMDKNMENYMETGLVFIKVRQVQQSFFFCSASAMPGNTLFHRESVEQQS